MAHFFFLAAFFWLNTMCFNIWWTFRWVVIFFSNVNYIDMCSNLCDLLFGVIIFIKYNFKKIVRRAIGKVSIILYISNIWEFDLSFSTLDAHNITLLSLEDFWNFRNVIVPRDVIYKNIKERKKNIFLEKERGGTDIPSILLHNKILVQVVVAKVDTFIVKYFIIDSKESGNI